MSLGRITYAFITTAAMGYSAASYANSWLTDQTVPAFGGEQSIMAPATPHSSYSDNIRDDKNLDPAIGCVARAVMREKGPGDILIAYTKSSGGWGVDLLNKQENKGLELKIGVGKYFEEDPVAIYNLSVVPLVKLLFNDDFSPKTPMQQAPAGDIGARIAEAARRCLSAS